jgi:two-component system KDP operon response regulator KdpE
MAAPGSSSRSLSTADIDILVVEDDPGLVRALRSGLQARGYGVTTAASGRTALEAATIREPDIVLLDLGLPDLDGVEVCRQLRRWLGSPVIVLTADGSEDRKILALDEGADDYITKPFSMPDLLARIRVAVRHRLALAAIIDDEVIEIGSLRIDVAAHDAWIDGGLLDLAPKEFALLTVLARNAGKVLTHRTLLTQLWADAHPASTQRLRTTVTTLRKKLGEGPERPRLVTEPAVGYRILWPQ